MTPAVQEVLKEMRELASYGDSTLAIMVEGWADRIERALAPVGEPVATVRYHTTGGNVGTAWSAVPAGGVLPPDGAPLYASPPQRWQPIESAPKPTNPEAKS